MRISDWSSDVCSSDLLITEISASTEAQASNLQQVNGAIGDMDSSTQQNAAMVEQSTAAARSLASEASELLKLVSRFNISRRSEERRVGKECDSTCRSRWARSN